MSYVVYWLNGTEPNAKHFTADELVASLKFSEGLRQTAITQEHIRFITIASEDCNSVGKQGVDVVGPDYDWKKRRI